MSLKNYFKSAKMLSVSHSFNINSDDKDNESLSILDLPVEILCLMLQNLEYENIINFSKTCKSIYILGNNPYIKVIVRERKCPFLKVLRLFPDKDWDWYHLSESDDVSIHFIKDHPDFKWNWKIISKRVKFEFVEQYKNLPWDWKSLIRRNFVFSHDCKKEKSHWFWPERIYSDSCSKDFKSFIYYHPLWPNELDWDELYNDSEKIRIEFIEEHVDKKWNWSILSQTISQDFLEKYPDKSWNWTRLSKRNDISTPEFVIQNPHFSWDWDELSLCKFKKEKRKKFMTF